MYYPFNEQRGAYKVLMRNRFIFVKNDLHPVMENIVLLHELGHDALHREEATKVGGFKEFEIFNIDHQKKYSTYSGLSLSGVEPCDSRVQFGPQLEQQQCYELQSERRFPPRLVGYYVICGHGFRCVSLLYFKGEVILRHVEKRRKNSD